MPRLKVDLTEAESRKPVPDDTYECIIHEIGRPQKGEKSTYVPVIFEIVEGDFKGRKLYRNTPITGKGAGMFVELVNKVTGENYNVDDLEDLEIDTEDLEGQPIGIVTKQREYPIGSGEFVSDVARLIAAE